VPHRFVGAVARLDGVGRETGGHILVVDARAAQRDRGRAPAGRGRHRARGRALALHGLPDGGGDLRAEDLDQPGVV
jgi:hypothetical protein